jgi:carboxypeptidase C (cathepsin A)
LARSYVTFPYNNTYGIQVYNQSKYEWALNELEKPGGGNDAITECRNLQALTDPGDHEAVRRLNKKCSQAEDLVMDFTEGLFAQYDTAGRFDITHEAHDPFPPPYMFGWLNQAHVQKALGVPVNHTWASPAVANAFHSSGDFMKGGQLQNLAYILDHGVNVALLHGDRDYACNWVSGEASSLKIPWSSQAEFSKAGYTPVALSSPYVQSGGLVRQHGNLSFTRVYQAGHMVPSYQPEAAYEIFMRAITHRDIATGQVDLRSVKDYATAGSQDTWWSKSDVLPSPPHECYIPALMDRCSDDEIAMVLNGSALVKDWIFVGKDHSKNAAYHESSMVETMHSSAQQPILA